MTDKKCKIENCDRDHSAKGYCKMHYDRVRNNVIDMRAEPLPRKGWIWKKDDPRRKNKGKLCVIPDCTSEIYAMDLCRVHYNLNLRNGYPSKKIRPKMMCKVNSCPRYGGKLGLCNYHRSLLYRGSNLNKPKGNKGELNSQWKGGISDYPDHHTLKKNRLIILNNANWTCKYCGEKADRIHHRDLSKDNHNIENLDPICTKCNAQYRKKYTSKYIRKYGMTLTEIALKLDYGIYKIRDLHNTGKLNWELNHNNEEIMAILF